MIEPQDLGATILATFYRAMLEQSCFADTTRTPWRDPITRACLDRTCNAHTSCARREAWAAFEVWFEVL